MKILILTGLIDTNRNIEDDLFVEFSYEEEELMSE
jgi:hypothetical protein